MVIHDWHLPGQRPGDPPVPATHMNVEPLWRTDPDGALSLRCVDKRGRVLSIAMSPEEADRLAEFLWARS